MFYGKRIAELEARVDALEKRVNKLVEKADRQNQKINNLLREVGAMKSKAIF